jgi:uncharacterized protein YdeI (YjbR/CyaY-like superfamily)
MKNRSSRRDRRVDAYIDDAAEFAQPILRHLREVVHEACPDVEEGVKWSRPHFDYKGIFCGMAAFKAHCTFGFWNDRVAGDDPAAERALERLGRLETMKDLPPKRTIAALVKKAMALNDAGVKPRWTEKRKRATPRPDLPVPDDLAAALKMKKNAKARTTFEGFSPSHRREYVEWIAEAKRDETRARRVAQTLEWLAEGKPRNWKYT